jgi:ribosomal protein S18 acetylase RimI-like enzyme
MTGSVHMVRRWAPGELASSPVPTGIQLRQLIDSDGEALGRLWWSGFGPHGQDGCAGVTAGRDEARKTSAGKWGPMIWEASVVAVLQQTVRAASVVVRDEAHQMLPLLAFVVTDPEHQRRGLGRCVVAETLWRMDALGEGELHRAVSPRNHASRLYHRHGFRQGAMPTP